MDRANPIAIAQRRPGSRPPGGPGLHSLWLSYAGLCLLCWLLYTVAGTEWQRGPLRLGEAAYEASWSLLPPMLVGALALPWAGWLQRRRRGLPANWLLHGLGALGFAALW